MKLDVIDNGSSVDVSDALFDCEFNEGLVHQAVMAHRSGSRAGTKAQKTRGEVRGGGRKPFKQKGTGRARQGSIRSPILIGGGVTFAAQPRDHSVKINKKMYRKALASILSQLKREGRIVIVNEIVIPEPKTKLLISWLKEKSLSDVLFVTDAANVNLHMASRNLSYVDVCLSAEIDPYILLKFESVCITTESLKQLEGRLV